MGRKRKAAGSSATGGPVNKNSDFDRSKFDIEETFADSEDEFQAGRDQILLDEGPEAKRQRKLAQQGWLSMSYRNVTGSLILFL